MKKTNYLLPAALLAGALCGCGDDAADGGGRPEAGAGVNFALEQVTTRAAFDSDNTLQINWTSGDKVRIYCDEAEDVRQADYEVAAPTADNKHKSTLKYNPDGLAWGTDDGTHNFYAVYPADDGKVSVSDGVATFKVNYNQTCTVSGTADANGHYATTPDMANAYMVASLSTKPVDEVSLSFRPIMTTLEVTVRGKETANTGTVTVTGISIVNKSIQYSGASQGQFSYDIANSKILAKGTNDTEKKTGTIFVGIKNNVDNHLDLEPGQSVTFTVFLPPVPIDADNQIDVSVHATGTTSHVVTIKGQNDANGNPMKFAASSKGSLTMPYFPTTQNGNNWITPLDDDIYVSQLSIPGTHDAATKDCSLDDGQCQTRSIEEQLEMGIRCFDLRPAGRSTLQSADALPIYHGLTNCNIDLKDVFDVFNAFLDENPGEFIITIMRWESEKIAINDEKRFNTAMNTFIGTTRYTKHALPREYCKKDVTVGEIRGKILNIMRPNQGSNPDEYFTNTAPHGMMFVSGFPGSHATGTQQAYLKKQYVDYGSDQWGNRTDWILYCQNYYEVNNESTVAASVSAKIASVKRYLDLSRDEAAQCSHVWTINHCSGYRGGSAIGSAYAQLGQEVNLPIYDYLMDANRVTGSTGIVLLDFVGDRVCQAYSQCTVYGDLLPQAIIDNNYKYRMKRKGE